MTTRRKALMVGAGAVGVGVGGYWALNRGADYEDAVNAIRVPQKPKSDADLDYLVHYATLAANSHNTQAWLFGKSGGRVTVSPDFKRSTPAVDPDSHHLFVSLGCAAENLMLAANAAGNSTAFAFDATGQGAIAIDFGGAALRDPLFDAIVERQCTRNEYDGKPVSPENLDLLVKAAKMEGCNVIIVADKSRMEQALELIIAADTVQVQDPAFRAELKSWIRFNAATAMAHRDGLYTACTGNLAMPQWLGNMVFDLVFKPASENDRYAQHIRSSSGLAVFVTDKDDKQHWAQAGRSYQRFALQATALGIRHAFLNQPVEVAPIRAEFATWLGTNGKRPDLVLRFGHGPAMPKSLRRPIKDLMV